MEKKICALELATYLVRHNWTVYVSCSSYVDVSIHLNSFDVSKLQQVLNSLVEFYHFSFEFEDRSGVCKDFYVCRCNFK